MISVSWFTVKKNEIKLIYEQIFGKKHNLILKSEDSMVDQKYGTRFLVHYLTATNKLHKISC